MWIALGATLPLRADFAEAFQRARAQFDRKEYGEARQAFEALAAAAPNARGAAASLSWAAVALGREGIRACSAAGVRRGSRARGRS